MSHRPGTLPVVDIHVHIGKIEIHVRDPRIDQVLALLDGIAQRLETIMDSQADVDAAVASIGLDVQGLTDSGVRIEAAIADLEAAGADTTALRAAIGTLDDAVGSIAAIVPVPDPVPDPVPAPDPGVGGDGGGGA